MKTDEFLAAFPAPLLSVFRDWLNTGWIPQPAAMGSPGASPPIYGTIRHFVATHSDLSQGEEQTPVWEFLGRRARVADGQQVSVREALRNALSQTTDWLLDMAVDRVKDASCEEQAQLRTLGRQKLLEQGVEQLTDHLMATFDAEVGHLRVVELFRRRRHEVGFASWSTYSAEMLSNARQAGKIAAGNMYLDLHRASIWSDAVAIEWVAGVRTQGPWLAVSSGMLYRFSRKTASRTRQLLYAADEVSGGDHERVCAFLNTHRDAEEILAKGDVIFLWEWERRDGTPPGTGLESLAAVCGQLRRRYRRLSSIVIAISPERMAPNVANEPFAIAMARLADLDKLRAYVLTLGERLGLNVFVTVSEQNDISRQPETVRPYC